MKDHEIKFNCINCGKEASLPIGVGTHHRNHCPFCLYTRHVDEYNGDRKSICNGKMKPIGLTYKNEGVDKYGKIRQGEIMLIHICKICGKISINRIAGDDKEEVILKLLKESVAGEIKKHLTKDKIKLLSEIDREEIEKQLYGQTNS